MCIRKINAIIYLMQTKTNAVIILFDEAMFIEKRTRTRTRTRTYALKHKPYVLNNCAALDETSRKPYWKCEPKRQYCKQ